MNNKRFVQISDTLWVCVTKITAIEEVDYATNDGSNMWIFLGDRINDKRKLAVFPKYKDGIRALLTKPC